MPLQYVTMPLRDLGAGIDQLSAENAIPEGFSEDLLNADPKPQGYLVKRPGYQGYSGYIPIRVSRLEYNTESTNNICFYLDGAIDLSLVRSSPIVVYGRTSQSHATGDWDDEDMAHYYPEFTADIRRQFFTGVNTMSIPSTDSGLSSPYVWVGTTASNNTIPLNNTLFTPDGVTIDQSTFDVDIDYTNNTGSTFNGFVYFKAKDADPGSVYVSAPVAYAVGTNTTTILASTHSLDNFNILVKTFIDTGTEFQEVIPDAVTINSVGDVAVTITNGTASSFNVVHILSATSILNVKTGSVAPNSSTTITISNISNPFIYLSCYLEPTLGATKEMVFPDEVAVDTVNNSVDITFNNNNPSAANFFIYYEFSDITSNKLCVTGEVILSPYTDDDPQLTIWGLDHRGIYLDEEARGGWVTGIDSYRSAGENRLVSALGGNLLDARTYSEASTQYLYPLLYPNMNNRIESTTIIGPAFYDTTDSPDRTRGYIQFNGGGEGWAKGISTEWDSGLEAVKYTLAVPGLSISGSLSSIISSSPGLEDYLTVQQSGYSINTGRFKVVQVANPSTDILEIWVVNDAVDSSDWDETDAGMECGVFTDQLPLTDDSTFTVNDRLISELFPDGQSSIEVQSSSTDTIVVRGLDGRLVVPVGLRLAGQRTSFMMPLRTLAGVSSVENVVEGDRIQYPDTTRLLKVVSVNPNGDISVTIDSDGETATVTLGSGSTTFIDVGQKLELYEAGTVTGTVTVTDVLSNTEFTFDSTEDLSGQTGILKGKTIELDEEFYFSDDTGSEIFIYTPSRWIPVEAPDDDWDLTPSTHYTYFNAFSVDNQPYLRSVMVSDNLYLENGADSAFKYDGTNIYRAGLFRWQPHLFVATDSTPSSPNTGEITITEISCAATARSGNRFTVADADANTFIPGVTIRDSDTGETYVVTGITQPATGSDAFIVVDRNIVGGSGAATLNQVNLFKYYFRLNAVDANNNVIASAVTGAEDFVLEISETTQVRMRLVGLPVWDVYDYDRLEVQIYRTKLNGAAPFYRLATIPMQFDNGQGYIDYVDTDADDVLRDLDEVNTALLGQELGTGWSHPQTAKYITSSANRLILGNITADPMLDINLVDTGTRIRPATGGAQLVGNIWTFRKDNNIVSSTTNMTSVARYEFVGSSADISDIVSSATEFTVETSAAHGLTEGDWVYLMRDTVADGNSTHFMGWFMVNDVPDTTHFSVLDDHNYTYDAAADVNKWVKATAPSDIPVYLGTDGNYGMANGNTDDSIFSYEFTALRRLANAINCSMRKVDSTLNSSFAPWMIANAGSEYNFGQLVITQPKRVDTFLEVQLPAFSGYNIFVNGVLRDSAEQVSAVRNTFPSRLLVSYPNYPEIMDNPGAVVDSQSQSAIDVNPADGQEITGIIPFFGDSAFGAALKDSIILVFKTNSIYVVNLAAKDSGQNAVQKVESQGLGCTAPYSIAPTKDGVMFANESGIYRITRSLQLDYVGRRLERIWREDVDRTRLDEMAGHYYSNGNQYKLSLPYTDDSTNDKVMVYNTVREYQADGYGMGSWTRYDNHHAIGWANLLTDAYLATTDGEVFSIRRAGDATDYRDDSTAINMQVTLRAMDFGDNGIRKAVGSLIVQYRTVADSSGIEVYSAPDLTEDFQQLDNVTIDIPQDNPDMDDLSDPNAVKMVSIRYKINDRKAVFIQNKIYNSNIDEPLEISGIAYKVAGLTDEGITQAAQREAADNYMLLPFSLRYDTIILPPAG